jgi:uncharacterized protein (TIGR01370 family)
MIPRNSPRVLLGVFLALSAVAGLAAGLASGIAATALALPSAGRPPAPTLVSPTQLQPEGAAAAERRRQMRAVTNWGYWLSNFELEGVAAAPHDLMVIDSEISANRTFERERSAAEVLRMKRRPDGSKRVLLAYLSIGEAERYRPYWKQSWYDPLGKPTWLGTETADGPGTSPCSIGTPSGSS